MEHTLRTTTLLAALLLTACSGGPSDAQIEEALEQNAKQAITDQLNLMKAFRGQGGMDMAKKMGMPDPEKVSIDVLSSEDMIKTENGDYTAKITFNTVMGDQKETGHARVTLSEVDGKWRVVSLDKL